MVVASFSIFVALAALLHPLVEAKPHPLSYSHVHSPSKRQLPGTTGTDSGPPTVPVFPSPNVTATGDWADAVRRAQQFVAQLTLEEKVNLTTGTDIFTRCVGNTGTIPRLGFKGFCLEDSPLGVRFADYVSAFPAGINAAMTWDHDLILQRGVDMGAEHRGKGVNVQLGPMMNMGRVAGGGRNWEGFGADPFLTGVCSALTVQGIQSQGVIASAKHYAANEQEHMRGGSLGSENGQTYSSDIDDRTMHEIYVWPFAESVKAGVGSIMCAYNRVNSTFACENSKLINGIAKEELDFKGFLLSDWAALVSGAPPALAGADMNMPGFIGYGIGDQNQQNPAQATNSFWGAALVELVRNGTVPEWRVTDMVTRTMAAFFKMGQDNGYPDVNFSIQSRAHDTPDDEHVNVQGDHFKTIRAMGSASAILLKHSSNSPLPLNAHKLPRQIAIMGSDAGPNPDGPNGCLDGNTDKGCSQGTLAMGWGSGTADFPYLIDPLSAISNWVHQNAPTTVIQFNLDDFNIAQTTMIAKQASVCFVFVNSDSGEGYIGVDGNQGDRNNITLWHGGEQTVQATAAQCAQTVVVIHAVGPVIVESWIDNPNITDVIFAGLPGQESGNGLLDVLNGAVTPSGRLPFTIAKQVADYPAQIVYTAPSSQTIVHIPYSEALEIDYRHFDAQNIAPRFEFGFGLSYTKFSYNGLSVNRASSFGKRSMLPRSPATPSPDHHTTTTTTTAKSTTSTGSHSSGSSSSSGTSTNSTSTATATATSNSTATVTGTSSGNATVTGTTSSVNATLTANATVTATGPAVTPTGGIGGNPALFDDAIHVSFTVRNTGGVDGSEVAQVYLGFPASAGEPPKVLRGFQKKTISRGSSSSFSITLRNKDVSIWDVVRQAWVIPSGQFTVFVGASSRDIRLSETFTNNNDIVIKTT